MLAERVAIFPANIFLHDQYVNGAALDHHEARHRRDLIGGQADNNFAALFNDRFFKFAVGIVKACQARLRRHGAAADKPLIEKHTLNLRHGGGPHAAAGGALDLPAKHHDVIQRFFEQYGSDLGGVGDHR